jgi:hypothetical protein
MLLRLWDRFMGPTPSNLNIRSLELFLVIM